MFNKRNASVIMVDSFNTNRAPCKIFSYNKLNRIEKYLFIGDKNIYKKGKQSKNKC